MRTRPSHTSPGHWITAFKVGSNWLLRDDDDTYAFYDGFENEELKKISSLCLYTSNTSSEVFNDTSCYKDY
jgi:hypothetical protein